MSSAAGPSRASFRSSNPKVTYSVPFFMHLDTRSVHILGITPSPHEAWMKRVARNVTIDDVGYRESRRYVVIDRA